MDEPQVSQERIGTVADEAARLVAALGGWATAAGGSDSPPEATESSQQDSRGSTRTAPSPESGEHQAATGPEADALRASEDCPHCGAPLAGKASPAVATVCRACPLCQGVGWLSAIAPETLDRLADLAAVAIATLRDLADQARSEQAHTEQRYAGQLGTDAAHRSSGSGARPGPRPGVAVEDIPVRDEDGDTARAADSRP